MADDTIFQWYIARIEPHNIPRARQEMIGKGLLYCPMRRSVYNIRGQRRSAEWPALVGYAFIFAPHTPASWRGIREVYGVREIMTPVGEPENGVPWKCPAAHVDHMRRLEILGEWDDMREFLAEIMRKPVRRRRERKMKLVKKANAA